MTHRELSRSDTDALHLPPHAAAAIVKAFWKTDAKTVVAERIAFAHLSNDAAAEACWRSLQPFL